MWEDLQPEIDALKQTCFGKAEAYRAFPKVADSFLRVLAHVLAHQHEGAWGQGPFPVVLAAHTLRLLRRMGVRLDDRWNIERSADDRGNLHRLTSLLVKAHHLPKSTRISHWADDVWDDCYVLLALDGAREELETLRLDPPLLNTLQSRFDEGLDWLVTKARDGFAEVPRAGWFGPAFYAAAIELIGHLNSRGRCQDGDKIVDSLTVPLRAALLDPPPWKTRFSWHVGQTVVMWKRWRGNHTALQSLDSIVGFLYQQMLNGQRAGGWGGGSGSEVDLAMIYNTTRALAACYLMEPTLASSIHVALAHDYLQEASERNPPLIDLKACVNAIEAYQELFDFRLPSPHLHLLIALLDRVQVLRLTPIVTPPETNAVATLREVRAAARRGLERRMVSALEPLGANGVLSDLLDAPTIGDEVLFEFHGQRQQTKKKLLRFLTTNMTEVRSNTARELIRDLWNRDGLLNFLPFVQRLSDLEHEKAYFTRYRDHVNHQVLFFLLGIFVHDRCPSLGAAVDREIEMIYRECAVEGRPTREEFLFRWKLAATFHDVGYLFEVSPSIAGSTKRAAEIKRLISHSLESVEAFRAEYLGSIEVPADITRKLKAYPRITKLEDLWALEGGVDNAFNVVSRHVRKRIPESLLRSYFELCRKESPSPDREPFLDHGIMSGLVLLKAADIQRFYLEQLRTRALQKRQALPERLRAILVSKQSHLEPDYFYVRFSHVAGAIALHNVYPGLHKRREVLKRYRLNDAFLDGPKDERFGISVEENPFSFLTAVVDALQDWDRHSFQKPAFHVTGHEPLSAADLTFLAEDGRIRIVPLSEAARLRLGDHYEAMKLTLVDLEKYVTFG